MKKQLIIWAIVAIVFAIPAIVGIYMGLHLNVHSA
jgi:hypothetical protein